MNDNDQKTLTTPTNKNLERRKGFRFSTHLPSILVQEEHCIYTTVINLSEDGVGFLSARPFKAGDYIDISFDYHQGHAAPATTVKLKVHVMSCREVDLEYYIGGSIATQPLEFKRFFKSVTPASAQK